MMGVGEERGLSIGARRKSLTITAKSFLFILRKTKTIIS
jgi:hypothetical protein